MIEYRNNFKIKNQKIRKYLKNYQTLLWKIMNLIRF